MFNIFGFYKFKKFNNLKKLKNRLENNLKDYEIRGTIIISPEGVNGTVSDKKNNLLKFNKLLKKILSIKKFNSENNSNSKFNPFHKLKIKIKKESVMGGMSCNEMSLIPWKILRYTTNCCLTVSDNKIPETVAMLAKKSFSETVSGFALIKSCGIADSTSRVVIFSFIALSIL